MMENNLRLSVNPEGIAELIFHSKDEKVNVLSTDVMSELDNMLDKIVSDKSIKVLVVKSEIPGIFIAGADIGEIAGIKSSAEAEEKSRNGQEIMNKLEKLPFPAVCAINGACLGGGLELALSCSFRIVSDSKKTRLGLPETTLGIMPGFGGTVRLMRLVGLLKGLPMILSGKPADGKKALRIKLADAVYSEAFMDEGISEFINKIINPETRNKILRKRKKRNLWESLMEGNPIGRFFLFFSAERNVVKKTRGFYPAPLIALEAILKNFKKKQDKALLIERKAFAKLAVTPEARHLTDIYLTGGELKKYNLPPGYIKNSLESKKIRHAGVLGAGKMGGGIAWLFSYNDISVRMKDISWNFIASGYKAIDEIYKNLVKIKKLDKREAGLKMHKVSGALDYGGFSSADAVIEAIVEDKDIKIKTLKDLEKNVGTGTIIATNTSSYSVGELSSGLENPERFIGFHFFNPVERMPLVEVVKGPKTSEDTVYRMVDTALKLGKTPIVVNDCSGFLVNRILMAYLNEALLMLEEGVSLEKIDKSLYDFGMPLGPFALLDEIGVKVGFKVAKILSEAYSTRTEPGRSVQAILNRNDLLGKNSGNGFYTYSKKRKTINPVIVKILHELKVPKNNKVPSGEITDRCILRMINEAAFCIEEKIIDRPEFLDLALVLGIGFPPFRGGLLRYAYERGFENCFKKLEKYENIYGKRFKPSDFLLKIKYGADKTQ